VTALLAESTKGGRNKKKCLAFCGPMVGKRGGGRGSTKKISVATSLGGGKHPGGNRITSKTFRRALEVTPREGIRQEKILLNKKKKKRTVWGEDNFGEEPVGTFVGVRMTPQGGTGVILQKGKWGHYSCTTKEGGTGG